MRTPSKNRAAFFMAISFLIFPILAGGLAVNNREGSLERLDSMLQILLPVDRQFDQHLAQENMQTGPLPW